jgi:hypothetical protein
MTEDTIKNDANDVLFGIWYNISVALEMEEVVMFNVTFNDSSVIPWQLVILVDENRESHPSAAIHWHTLSLKCCIEYTSPCGDIHWFHR